MTTTANREIAFPGGFASKPSSPVPRLRLPAPPTFRKFRISYQFTPEPMNMGLCYWLWFVAGKTQDSILFRVVMRSSMGRSGMLARGMRPSLLVGRRRLRANTTPQASRMPALW